MLNDERILSLDVSSKTGWASMISTNDGIVLEQSGIIPAIHQPEGVYPQNFLEWVDSCFVHIIDLIDRFAPDVLVIEETVAGSKEVYSQKFLEWMHYRLAKLIKETSIRAVYLLTGTWRSEVGAKMTKEESKHNKYVREYKQKYKTKVAKGADGKRVGIKTKKHVNIRRANEIFGEFLPRLLQKKDEDEADALLLGYCYHLRRIKNESRSLG